MKCVIFLQVGINSLENERVIFLCRSLSTCHQSQQCGHLTSHATDGTVCIVLVNSTHLPFGEVSMSGFVWTVRPHLMADTRLLQKILLHTSAFEHSVLTEEDLQIFPKATGVVVADCFRISKRCARESRDVWTLSTTYSACF